MNKVIKLLNETILDGVITIANLVISNRTEFGLKKTIRLA